MAPDAATGKQWAVSALGGTQAGVNIHAATNPFTFTFDKPKQFRSLGKANPVTNVIAEVPRNVFKARTRKGQTPLAGQPYQVCQSLSQFEVAAGADVADAPNVKAMVSFHIGCLSQLSSGIADTLLTGVV
jgi:hypothetical protein